MVRGRGKNGQLGKKIKIRVREKREKKKEENYIKKGEKGLKMHLFGLQTPKNFDPIPCKLICREKKLNLKRGGE